MLSMFCVQHASHRCNSLKSALVQTRCSFASGAHQAWAHKPPCLTTQSEPYGDQPNAVLNQGSIPASSHYDRRKRLSAFWTPTGGIEAPEDAKGQNTREIMALQLTALQTTHIRCSSEEVSYVRPMLGFFNFCHWDSAFKKSWKSYSTNT